mmetsp:Transcript_125250/g.365821  ORF Transcript_125250/g.365821 Transcript_125250/m.365821 type:complete len:279 (-) Transcript_125250:411-1247(-)
MCPSELGDCLLLLGLRDLVGVPPPRELPVGLGDRILVRASRHIQHLVGVLLVLVQHLLRGVHHSEHPEDEAVVARRDVADLHVLVHGLLAGRPHSPPRSHAAHEAQLQAEVSIALLLLPAVGLAGEGDALAHELLPRGLGLAVVLLPRRYVRGSEGELQCLQFQRQPEVHLPVGLGLARHLHLPQLRWDHGDAHVLALLVLHGDLHGPPVHPLHVVDDLALDAPQLQRAVLAAQERALLAHADVVGVVAALADVAQQVPLGSHGTALLLHELHIAHSL